MDWVLQICNSCRGNFCRHFSDDNMFGTMSTDETADHLQGQKQLRHLSILRKDPFQKVEAAFVNLGSKAA